MIVVTEPSKVPGSVGRGRHSGGPASWPRWTTLAMLGHAFLTVLADVTRSTESHQPELIAIATVVISGCVTRVWLCG